MGGGGLPGVRIELNPASMNKYGLGFEQVRGVLSGANANTPKGHFSYGDRMVEVGANDQLFHAVDYNPLIVTYHNGSAVRISDIGLARDAPETLRAAGYSNGKPSILLILFRQARRKYYRHRGWNSRRPCPSSKPHHPRGHSSMQVAMDQTSDHSFFP